jgi:transcriptional regulator with XRE-family HTH domain
VPTMREWTGREAKCLRLAARLSVRAFAERLGLAPRTVSKWEQHGSDTRPRPDTQAILDTFLGTFSIEEHERFSAYLNEVGGTSLGATIVGQRTPDHEAWADDLERAVVYLAKQGFRAATGILERWLSSFDPGSLDTRSLYLHARTLILLGDVRRDQGGLIGPKSAQTSYKRGRDLYVELDIPRRVAQADLSLAVITEMAGHLEPAARRYHELAADTRLSGRDRARARLWVGTALSKEGLNAQAVRVMRDAAHQFELLDEPEDWSVAHQKIALAYRGGGRLDEALKCIDVALGSAVDDSPMQRVRLSTAHGHILITDPKTRAHGIVLLGQAADLAGQYGLTHQQRAITAIRSEADQRSSARPATRKMSS